MFTTAYDWLIIPGLAVIAFAATIIFAFTNGFATRAQLNMRHQKRETKNRTNDLALFEHGGIMLGAPYLIVLEAVMGYFFYRPIFNQLTFLLGCGGFAVALGALYLYEQQSIEGSEHVSGGVSTAINIGGRTPLAGIANTLMTAVLTTGAVMPFFSLSEPVLSGSYAYRYAGLLTVFTILGTRMLRKETKRWYTLTMADIGMLVSENLVIWGLAWLHYRGHI